jgi:hypothetical protein
MSSERPEEFSEPASSGRQGSDDRRDRGIAGNQGPSDAATPHQTTVVVRGETVRDQEAKSPSKDSPPKEATVVVRGEAVRDQEPKLQPKDAEKSPPNPQPKDKEKSPPKAVSEAKIKMQSRLPALYDDSDGGVQKDQVVARDGKADLAFTGTLTASVAPSSAPKGKWQEYRIYETNGGKHVFSKVSRSVFAEEQDAHEAEVFDPSPSSMPTQLLRSARDLARSHPLTWTDAAIAFFGYDPLAKALYKKLGGKFEEHIS